MKKLIFVLLMVMYCTVWADWVKIMDYRIPDKSGVIFYYFDPATIRKIEGRRTVWQLSDFKGRDEGSSTRYLTEYDCGQERSRDLDMTLHTGNMAVGEGTRPSIKFPTQWGYVAPKTYEDIVMKIVCAK